MRPITANSLSTAEVRSPSGENLGKIVDFMLDTERGSVVYAVLATGGVLGVAAKMLAVPPRSLKLSDDRCLEIDVDTAALDAADGIDRANPPESADATLREPSASESSRAASHAQGRNHG
jgi:sporulation protein YlmC with PRC-barrel domain